MTRLGLAKLAVAIIGLFLAAMAASGQSGVEPADTEYAYIRRNIYPKFDEARCSEDLRAVIKALFAAKPADNAAHVAFDDRVEKMRATQCVGPYFSAALSNSEL